MKKKLLIITVVLVLICIVSVLTVHLSASSNSSSSAEEETRSYIEVEIPIGKYYLGGDKNSEFYFNVMEDHKLEIVCPDLKQVLRDSVKDRYAPEDNEGIERAVEKNYSRFYGVKDYMGVYYPDPDITMILIEWNYYPDGMTGMGFSYPRENVITCTFVDDEFILVE